MPARRVMVRGSVLPAGTQSIAPCTVAKSPEPSAATVTAAAVGAGPAARTLNVKFPAASGVPAASVKTPASQSTR